MDGNGNFCGLDEGFEDYPYLFFAKLNPILWAPYAVCAKTCPMKADVGYPKFDCKATTNVGADAQGQCTVDDADPYDTTLFLERWCMPQYSTLSLDDRVFYDNVVGSIGLDDVMSYVRDIERAKYLYLVAIGTCLVFIFAYNWMLRCFAEILTWIAIFAVAVGLFALGWMVRDYGALNYVEGDNTQKWLNIAAYTIWGLLGIYLLSVCCLYYSIKISVRVLRTSAKIITRNMRMVIVPVVGILITIVWVAFSVYFLLWLMSSGEIKVIQVPGIIPGGPDIFYSTYVWTDE